MCQIVTLTLPNGEIKSDKIDCNNENCPVSDSNKD